MIWDNFIASLKLMGMGMSGIFIFILIFYGLVLVLMKIFPYREAGNHHEKRQ